MIKDYGKISIIVPVYNVEQYVEKSLKSIMNQTYKNLEIIIINDGSTDNSEGIIKETIKDDKRCLLYTQENKGIGYVRNTGLSYASGDFIGWVDSDDYIEPTMYEDMIKHMFKYESDMVQCDALIKNPDGESVLESYSSDFGTYIDCKPNYDKVLITLTPLLWNKLSKKEIFENITFPNHVFEDSVVALKIINNCTRISFIKKPYYNYLRYRSGNTMTNKSLKFMELKLKVSIQLYEEVRTYTNSNSVLKHFYLDSFRIYRSFKGRHRYRLRKYKKFYKKERKNIILSSENKYNRKLLIKTTSIWGRFNKNVKRKDNTISILVYVLSFIPLNIINLLSYIARKTRVFLVSKMNKLVECLKILFQRILNLFIPKKSNRIVFTSSPDVSDNTRNIYKEMLKQELYKDYEFVWIVKDLDKYKDSLTHSKVYKKGTFKAALAILRAKYILLTHHGFHKIRSKRQVVFQCWHGSTLKNIGRLDKQNKRNSAYNKLPPDYLSVSAELFREKMAYSLNITKEQAIITGYPRNDCLYEKMNIKEKLGIKAKKVIMWMPTWRYSDSFYRGDGIREGFEIPLLSFDNIVELNEKLSKLDIVLLVKLHRVVDAKNKLDKYSNIIEVDNDLFDLDFSVYTLLGNVDALLTDYSSVYFDFLLVDKPIGFIYHDFEEYERSRGFSFEKPKDYMPGEHITEFEGLLKFIDDVGDNIDEFKDIRKKVNQECNYYKDDKNSQRFIKHLKKINP